MVSADATAAVPDCCRAPTVLVLSWDGLRHDHPDLHSDAVPLPSLVRIATEGVRAKRLTPVFPSNTFPDHVSIATGTYPDRHGIPDNVFFDRAEGLYRYDPMRHLLQQAVASDVRGVSGDQDFVDSAPLDLIYVADHSRMGLVPAARREPYAFSAAGAMAQNVYLYCASAGLGTVIRAWFDAHALSQAMGLTADQQLLLAQTVGYPAGGAPA